MFFHSIAQACVLSDARSYYNDISQKKTSIIHHTAREELSVVTLDHDSNFETSYLLHCLLHVLGRVAPKLYFETINSLFGGSFHGNFEWQLPEK